MRTFRALGLLWIGAWAGFMAAAAIAKRAIPSHGDEESDEVGFFAIMNGIELKSRAKNFRGGSMFAWYGGIAVDLREATLAPDVQLSTSTLFGGIALRVPPDTHIESNLKALMGGVDVKKAEVQAVGAPTLTLEGFALFGGISVSARGSSD
jgi:hypothetical protein